MDAARRSEADPDHRAAVGSVLESLGIDELDPLSDLDTAAAAGELCRAAGRVALPYPVVAALLREPGGGPPLALVPTAGSAAADSWAVDHGDLFREWTCADLDGRACRARPAPSRLGTRLGPFVAPVEATGPAPGDGVGARVDMHLTLGAWVVLGYVERALELAVEHVRGRVQFGQPLAAFQAVQFQLADAAVIVDGLRELCRFTLWRVVTNQEGARPDALGVRLHALDGARATLRTCQQLHGAAGLCDEYDVSILCRHIQPALRLPFSAERTADELAAAVERSGFAGLFPHGGGR
ncbi:MAG TPA: acyl-CoA dehydrogenase family protein [Acidimicrobiales bacterium]|nr:acyl-CoA dehydrogenase family protein [Acidimicrobiales bacterium]